MDQHSNPSPSFINIFVLLLFAVVIAGASAVTTYVLLNTRSNEQYSATQTPIVPQPQTIIQPTSAPIDTQQTTIDETAGWKVYRNTKVGFTINYPARYDAPSLPSGVGDSPIMYADGTENDATIIFSGTDPDDSFFTLIISPFNGNVIDLVENQKKNLSGYEIPYIQQSDLVVDGKKALRYFTKTNATGVYFTGKNHSFIFYNDGGPQKEFKQILSTFKFTE